MATPAAGALPHVRRIVQINDWSLCAIAPIGMKTGCAWIGAERACSVAPIAVTPEALGHAWQHGWIDGRLDVALNGARFGAVPSRDMQFGSHERIAQAARTRSLCADTIIGSGTVSTPACAEAGSRFLAERRAVEAIERGATRPFGTIDQRVVASG